MTTRSGKRAAQPRGHPPGTRTSGNRALAIGFIVLVGACALASLAPQFYDTRKAATTAQAEAVPRQFSCDVRVNNTPAVLAGGVTSTLERAVRDFPQLSPRVLSHTPGPGLIVFDTFLQQGEAAQLRAACKRFQMSATGEYDEHLSIRRSSTCWCDKPECRERKVVRHVARRISDVTATATRNAMYLQFLRYDTGGYYRNHHDQASARDSPQGGRLWTLLIYLNTVAQGGGTRFNDLGIDVAAVEGRAILWNSLQT